MPNIKTFMGNMVECPRLLESCKTAKINVVIGSCLSCPDFGGKDVEEIVCRYSSLGRKKKNYKQLYLDIVDRDMDPSKNEIEENLDNLL